MKKFLILLVTLPIIAYALLQVGLSFYFLYLAYGRPRPPLPPKAAPLIEHGDDYYETETFKNLSTLEKIEEISFSLSLLYRTFEDKTAFSDVGGDLNPEYFAGSEANLNTEYIENNFLIDALRTDKATYEQNIKFLKEAGIDEPEFFALLAKSMAWAEEQKGKNAEELYAMAHNLTFPYEPYLLHQKQGLQRELTALAAKKGHKQAKVETGAANKELETFIKEFEQRPDPYLIPPQ
ncbi:MAG: hypothetical protein KDJ75_07875 [Alphaproteobacteria bacterium]|nr:hypothetical protein [Alphaproteobacteria bacterium]